MSCLKLFAPQTFSVYCPDDVDAESAGYGTETDHTAPVILPISRSLKFQARAAHRPANRILSILERTRVIHKNRCCPECGRAAVELIGSEQALMSRDHMPIPGAGTLVGFQCNSCDHTWGIDD